MLKVLKVTLANLFPKTIQFAHISVYIYPFNKTFFDTTKRIFLPVLVGEGKTNYNGIAEFQLTPNDIIEPKPNYYVIKVFYNGKNYYFVAQITSDMPDIVDLKDVLIQNHQNCQNNSYLISGENVYI